MCAYIALFLMFAIPKCVIYKKYNYVSNTINLIMLIIVLIQ